MLNSSGHNIAHGGFLRIPSGSSVATLVAARGNKGDTITPAAVRVDGAGNRILTDGSSNAISLPPGASAGTEYQLPGLQSPAVDGAGNLFLNSLPYTGTDHKFVEYFGGDPNNSATFLVSVNSHQAGSTASMALDPGGNLYLTGDFGSTGSRNQLETVAMVPASQLADLSTCCTGTGSTGPAEAVDVAFDSVSDLVVSDARDNGVSYTGNPVLDGKGFNSPQGLAFDADGNLFIFDVGNGRIVKIDGSHKSFNFADTAIGSASQDSPKGVAVENLGTSTLILSSITYPADFVRDTLQSQSSRDCITSSSLAPGDTCNLSVDFVPQTTGPLSEAIVITDNSGATHSVNVSGTGVGDSVTLSASSLTFGNEAVGYSTVSQNVILTNKGSAVLTFNKFAFDHSPEPNFFESNTCGKSLAAGASCRIGIRFTPSATGPATETFYIYDNGINPSQTISLSGTGVPSVPTTLTLSSSNLTFGSEAVGFSTGSQNVTVTNTSTATLCSSSIALTGTGAGSYKTSNTCGASVAAGASCRIGVRFVPSTTGSFTGAVTLTDNATGSPQSISLSGTGINAPPASVSLSSSALQFGQETVGTSTATQNVTVTNTSSVVLYFNSIALAGTNAGSYVTSNTCAATLAAGASCRIGVRFVPVAAGPAAASINLTDNANSSPQTITLNGQGVSQ